MVPAATPAREVLKLQPDGVFLSQRPRRPGGRHLRASRPSRSCSARRPLFGICLGHQLLALALGMPTYKLKFGHRGANHPVKDLTTGEIEITTQNHGFAVRDDGAASHDRAARDHARQPERRHRRGPGGAGAATPSRCSTTPSRRRGRTTRCYLFARFRAEMRRFAAERDAPAGVS